MENTIVCSSAEDLLAVLDDNSVGAIITDPPFWISIGRAKGWTEERGEFVDPWSTAPDLQSAMSEVAPVIKQAQRVLRPGGALAVMGQGIAATVWDYLARSNNLDWMAELTVLWNTGKPRLNNFGSLHTRVSWYSKPGAKHTFNSGERRSIYSNVLVVTKVPIQNRRHPSEKPVALTNFLVSLLTKETDLVVDPYCGSGSTLVSAAICGRRWLGSDLDPSCAQGALTRTQQYEVEEVDDIWLWINNRLEKV